MNKFRRFFETFRNSFLEFSRFYGINELLEHLQINDFALSLLHSYSAFNDQNQLLSGINKRTISWDLNQSKLIVSQIILHFFWNVNLAVISNEGIAIINRFCKHLQKINEFFGIESLRSCHHSMYLFGRERNHKACLETPWKLFAVSWSSSLIPTIMLVGMAWVFKFVYINSNCISFCQFDLNGGYLEHLSAALQLWDWWMDLVQLLVWHTKLISQSPAQRRHRNNRVLCCFSSSIKLQIIQRERDKSILK